jgi:hypothetical protein
MLRVPLLDTLETDRLVLRQSRVDEAVIYRQLWMERDPRVPPHRRIDATGRPAVEDVAAEIRAEHGVWSGLLAVERKTRRTSSGIAVCLLVGMVRPTSLSWPTSCCVRLTAAVTQLRQDGLWSPGRAKRATVGCGLGSATGMPRRGESWRSSSSANRAGSSLMRSTVTAC